MTTTLSLGLVRRRRAEIEARLEALRTELALLEARLTDAQKGDSRPPKGLRPS